MAFCSHGLKAAKDTLHKLDGVLEPIIDGVLKFTGTMMANPAWPLVAAALSGLPGGAVALKGLQIGLDALSDQQAIKNEPDTEKKLKLFMDDLQKYDPNHQHALLVKLASIATAYIHGNKLTETQYDTLTQVKVLTNKAEAKAA